MNRFLEATTIIDWQDDRVLNLAAKLKQNRNDDGVSGKCCV